MSRYFTEEEIHMASKDIFQMLKLISNYGNTNIMINCHVITF